MVELTQKIIIYMELKSTNSPEISVSGLENRTTEPELIANQKTLADKAAMAAAAHERAAAQARALKEGEQKTVTDEIERLRSQIMRGEYQPEYGKGIMVGTPGWDIIVGAAEKQQLDYWKMLLAKTEEGRKVLEQYGRGVTEQATIDAARTMARESSAAKSAIEGVTRNEPTVAQREQPVASSPMVKNTVPDRPSAPVLMDEQRRARDAERLARKKRDQEGLQWLEINRASEQGGGYMAGVSETEAPPEDFTELSGVRRVMEVDPSIKNQPAANVAESISLGTSLEQLKRQDEAQQEQALLAELMQSLGSKERAQLAESLKDPAKRSELVRALKSAELLKKQRDSLKAQGKLPGRN